MLLPAMIQASQPVSVTGPLVFVLLLALALALPISFGLIKLYRRAVWKSMRARINFSATEPSPQGTSISTHPAAPSSPGERNGCGGDGPTRLHLTKQRLSFRGR